MKAIIYTRISQDRIGDEAGVQRQRDDCRARATDRGWEVIAEHEDNDQSASSGRTRPGFEAMLADLESGRADVVIAWTLDRLQRNRRDELRLYELCRAKDATISLVRGPDVEFATPAGRYVADSLGSIARLEVEMKSDRQQRAQQQAAAAGRRVGGRRPFGYDADGITVRPTEAAAIKQAYADLLAGLPLAHIARTWNAAGLRSGQTRWKPERRGEPSEWAPDTVKIVLRNPRYAGKRAYKGEVVAEAVWPALVTEEVWQAAVALLNSRRHGRPNGSKYLLTGVAVCGVCGAGVHGGGAARRDRPGYRCSGSKGHVARLARPVDEYVGDMIVARLSEPDAADLLVDDTRPDVGALRAEAAALRSRLDSLATEFADGELTASQLRTATERLRSRLADAEGKMADAGRADVLGPLVGADDVQAAWDALPQPAQRAVIETLARVTIHPPGRGVRTFRPESVKIEWRQDTD